MKNCTKLAAILLVAMSMQSCFFGAIKDATRALEELSEVTSGKVFQIPSAVVEYDNGVTFAFKENGKYQYEEDGDNITIITPTALYELDKQSKTYYKQEIDMEGRYSSNYVFLYENWVLAKTADRYDPEDDDIATETKKTICGKSCPCFTETNGDAEAGWKRILLYKNESGTETTAIRLVEKAEDSLFSIPAGYTEEEY